MTRAARLIRLVLAVAASGTAAAIVLARAGVGANLPPLVALLGTAVALSATAGALVAGVRCVYEAGDRVARAGEAALLAGLAVVAGAGLANWALGFRGLLVLTEGEQVALGDLAGFRDIAAGPFAEAGPRGALVRLLRVELTPAPGGVAPRSRLHFAPVRGQPPRELAVERSQGVEAGALLLHQGAFGFVPRVIVQREGRTLHDAYVHMAARAGDRGGFAHEGTITVEDGVTVTFAVDLSGLDEELKGHPVLGVEVRHGKEILGRGELLPGHGATMKGGWHVGFAGMRRWSEIDVSRGSFRGAVLAGMVLAGAGGAVWASGRLRRRRPRPR